MTENVEPLTTMASQSTYSRIESPIKFTDLNNDPIIFSSIWILIVAVLLFAYSRVRGKYKRQQKRLLRERESRWNSVGRTEPKEKPDSKHSSK